MGSGDTSTSALIVLSALCTSLLQMSVCSQVVQPDIWEFCVACSHSMTSSFYPDDAADISHHSAYYAFKLERAEPGSNAAPISTTSILQPLFFTLKASPVRTHTHPHPHICTPTHTQTCMVAGKSRRGTNNKVSLLLTLAHS